MVTTAAVEDLLAGVVDPEIPVLTIADLGMVRGVSIDDTGAVTVTLTPTYSGCPALDVIKQDITSVLGAAGYDRVVVDIVFSPAWTTDWMSDEARRKLNGFGIAPPGPVGADETRLLCPRCSSPETRVVSSFGSTACKALAACRECGEPFDHFKAI
jgi:ring-1,2-phenylacetyl-CoA epoxidase subunit PaaD